MSVNDYDPATALDAYYPTRDERRTARLWTSEKLAQDLAQLGIIELFVGAGTDATAVSGYAITSLWLQVSAGVTDAPGTLRGYAGAGDASDIANWPAMTPAALSAYIAAGTFPVALDQGGTGSALSDPGADRLLGWDDSESGVAFFSVGAGLEFSGAALQSSIVDATTSVAGYMSAADKTKLDAIEAAADVTDASNVGTAIVAASAKTTPVSADRFGIIDSAAGDALKPITYGNLSTAIVADATTAINPGKIIQRKATTTAAATVITATIPYDDTIPQITEGTEILTLSITPSHASNIIRFRVNGSMSSNGSNYGIVAIFKDGAASAIAASIGYITTGAPVPYATEHSFIAGGTSAITLTVRVGPNANTLTLNGNVGSRVLGGVLLWRLEVEEIAV